jgi:hypothetical protein
MREAYPLAWPDGWRRTRLNDLKPRGAWKQTRLEYKKALEDELRRMGAKSVVITCNITPETFASSKAEPRDVGVAVYFSKPPADDDFSWQEILEIDKPDPTVAEIDQAFVKLSKVYHTDNLSTGDLEMFKKINEARKRAKAWVTGDYGREHEHVIACDKYNKVVLNIAAIRVAIAALRRIEECGASGILERAFKGFSALPERSEHGTAAAS